jgi:tetratricopeptide (TPR) repeat protein
VVGRDDAAPRAAADSGRGRRRPIRVELPALRGMVGAERAVVLADQMGTAAREFADERYADCRRRVRRVLTEAPDLPEGRELLGLCQYRLGRWRDAVRELERFRELTGSTEQHPVLADCYRALGRHQRVAELWEELREDSPSAALVAEGRIVAAGSLADQGDLPAAIRLLARGFRFPKAPQEHHLRRAYALADLYERAGDVPQARALFVRLVQIDPDYLDVGARLRALD